MTAFLLSAAILFLWASLLLYGDLRHPLLWKISLAATEAGHYLALLPLAVAVHIGWSDALSAFTALICILSAVIMFAPAVRASLMARSVRQHMNEAIGTSVQAGEAAPFRWRELWFGPRLPVVAPERHCFAGNEDEGLRLLLFRSRFQPPAPCVVMFHTGGWDSGSPEEFPQMNRYLASIGYTVAAIEYRFAPQHRWPAQKEDALAALSFLKTHAGQFGIDASRFVLFGRSAGGQIAAATAYTADDPAIKGCIALYSPFDLLFAYEHLDPEPDILDSRTLLHNYLGGPPSAEEQRYLNASPFHAVGPNTPPTLLLHGAKDPLTWFRQSERLARRLTQHRIPSFYLELPWGTHAFDYLFHGPGGQLTRYTVRRFLSSVLPL